MEQLRALGPLAVILLCSSCGGVTERRSSEGSQPPASCDLRTEFADDGACLPALDPESGFTLHFGPDDYENPQDFLVRAGEEVTTCRVVALPADPLFVARWVAKSRSNVADFEILAAPAGIDPCRDHRARLLALSETGELDLSVGAAPEYAGAALRIGPSEQVAVQVHALNTAALDPVLSEVWINAYTTPRPEVSQIADTLALVATDTSGDVVELGRTSTITAERALLGLSGHVHFSGDTLDVYRVRGAERTFLYRQRGFSRHFLKYDSVSRNREDDTDPDGVSGTSGPIVFLPGDSIEWTCALTPGSPGGPLAIRPEQICVLRGWYAPSDGHWLYAP